MTGCVIVKDWKTRVLFQLEISETNTFTLGMGVKLSDSLFMGEI